VCMKLKERKMRILDRNVREKFAEIDIVAEDGDVLCFIEVRTRQDATLGHPAETITPAKQRSVRRAAEAYLVKRRISSRPIRFDVATIIWSSMNYEYFENAF
jgi:putative endonuclease